MLISRQTPKSEIVKLVANECKQCGHCCMFGSGIVLSDELKPLAKAFNLSVEDFKTQFLEEFTKFNTKHYRFKQLRKGDEPHGRCIFLDVESKQCKIHLIKPLHCRVSTCSLLGEDIQKWFDVNFFLNPRDVNSLREYKLYLEFKKPLPGANLEDIATPEMLKKLNYEVNQNGRREE